ncbi:hypothetical protein NQZ79_g3129 [Umbelopsis isabellina]|nr:hypothetical protein NQZ79_g3129 [Umbelopsis isabellina]
MQAFFLSNLQAIVHTGLSKGPSATDAEKAIHCKDKTSGSDPKVHQTINGSDELHARFCSLCKILAILTQLIRQSCAYEPCNHSVRATHKYHLSDNNYLATSMVDGALNTLCATSDLSKILYSASSGGREYECLEKIYYLEEEIYSMLHDQCSISLPIDDENIDEKLDKKANEIYECLGIAPNFPKYIIKTALELIHRKPSSVLPLLKLICDLLPDVVNDNIESLNSSSQRLRSYWRNALAKLCDDLLSLRHFIISNDCNISEAASIALAKVCHLFSSSNGFQRRIKSILYQEMNAYVAYAIHMRSTDAVLTYKKLELVRNEVMLRRWLSFTARSNEFDDINMYFTQALSRINLPAEIMQSFSSSGENSMEFFYENKKNTFNNKQTRLLEDSLSAMLNVESVLDILKKGIHLNSERKELYKEQGRNVQGAMCPINQSNHKTNIGGGKAYNRNEFRAVHGVQSVNASRPPSVHVDDFSIVQT